MLRGSLAFVVFSPALSNEFVRRDDFTYVVDNPIIRDLGWDGRGTHGDRIASSVYFVRMMVGNQIITRRKLVLLQWRRPARTRAPAVLTLGTAPRPGRFAPRDAAAVDPLSTGP